MVASLADSKAGPMAAKLVDEMVHQLVGYLADHSVA